MEDTFTYRFTCVMSRENMVVWSEVSDLSGKVMIMEFLSSPCMVSALWWRKTMKIDWFQICYCQIQFGKLFVYPKLEIYLKLFIQVRFCLQMKIRSIFIMIFAKALQVSLILMHFFVEFPVIRFVLQFLLIMWLTSFESMNQFKCLIHLHRPTRNFQFIKM